MGPNELLRRERRRVGVKFAERQNEAFTRSRGRQLRDLALFDDLPEVRGHGAVVIRKLCIERPLVSLARLPGSLFAPGGLGFVHLHLGLKIRHFGTPRNNSFDLPPWHAARFEKMAALRNFCSAQRRWLGSLTPWNDGTGKSFKPGLEASRSHA